MLHFIHSWEVLEKLPDITFLRCFHCGKRKCVVHLQSKELENSVKLIQKQWVKGKISIPACVYDQETEVLSYSYFNVKSLLEEINNKAIRSKAARKFVEDNHMFIKNINERFFPAVYGFREKLYKVYEEDFRGLKLIQKNQK